MNREGKDSVEVPNMTFRVCVCVWVCGGRPLILRVMFYVYICSFHFIWWFDSFLFVMCVCLFF